MHLHDTARGRGAHSAVIRTPGCRLVSSLRRCSYGCTGSDDDLDDGENGDATKDTGDVYSNAYVKKLFSFGRRAFEIELINGM